MEAVAPSCVVQQTVAVVLNEQVAQDTFLLRLDAPEIARTIIPGQFLMVRAGSTNDPLLGRPFALYDVVRDGSGAPRYVDVVYLVIGRGTKALAQAAPGERLPVWGPLGNGFGPAPSVPGHIYFVAGGIGQTPFLALGKWWRGETYGGLIAGPPWPGSITLFYGVRTRSFATRLDDFADAGIAVELATDDGSAGHPGFVTDLLQLRLERGERPARVVGCGPPPCSERSPSSSRNTRSPAICRLRTTWPAASARALAASRRSDRPTAGSTSAASASKARSSPPPTSFSTP